MSFVVLKQFLSLPWTERRAKLKKAIADRMHGFFFSTAGHWLNRRNHALIMEYRPDFHSYFDRLPGYELLFEGWTHNNRSNNSGDLTRFYTIYLNINQVLEDGVPGDFVELGVYKGNSATLLALLGRAQNRQTFLFDTFGGFDPRDLRGVDGAKGIRFTDTSFDAVQNLVGTEGVKYVPGFFPDSILGIQLPEQIAVAHIDCDLYQPMKAGLECFYPRLSVGGVLLMHDYSSGHWPGAKRAVDEFFANLPEKPICVADKSGTAIVRKHGSLK